MIQPIGKRGAFIRSAPSIPNQPGGGERRKSSCRPTKQSNTFKLPTSIVFYCPDISRHLYRYFPDLFHLPYSFSRTSPAVLIANDKCTKTVHSRGRFIIYTGEKQGLAKLA